MAQSKPCFSDLPEDMLIEIFSRLPPKYLLSFEQVNRTWKRCVDKTLNRVQVVTFEIPFDFPRQCQHFRRVDLTKTLDILDREKVRVKREGHSCRTITSSQIDSLVRLLKRCPQVKSLSLDQRASSDIEFKDVESFEKVLKALPQLECLRYGRFRIEKLINSKWLTLCQEFGPRLKHLIVDRYVQDKEMINSLIGASVNLEFVFLEWYMSEKCHHLKALQNRDSIELSLDFYDTFEVDAEDAAVISRATNLTIQLVKIQLVGQHFPTFSRLKRLNLETYSVVNEVIAMNFPALEHLNWNHKDWGLNSALFAKHLTNYNLPGLKTLEINQLDDDVLTDLADQLTSLEKLVLRNACEHLPTSSLQLLSPRLIDLEINYWFNWSDKDERFPKVIEMFESLAKRPQLKRCRIDITPAHFDPDEYSGEFDCELRHANRILREAQPFVEIEFPFFNWLVNNISDDEEESDNLDEERNNISDKEATL